jgi:NitT/TauT family transport system permease protein
LVAVSILDDLREARRRTRLPLPRNLELVYPILLLVAAVGGWQLWVSVADVPEYQFPRPTEVWDVLIHSPDLPSAAAETILLIVFGFLLAVGLGLLLAMLTAGLRPFEIGFFPIIVSTQFVPLIALTPLFVIWLGFGSWPKLVVIMLFGYFSVLITALTGLRSVEQEKLYLARSMGAGRVQALTRIRLPGALPHVFGGIKIAVTSCVIGAVIAEFFIGSDGLGFQILRAQGNGDSKTLIAAVVYLAGIGAVAFLIVSVLERLALPWYVAQRTRQRPAP